MLTDPGATRSRSLLRALAEIVVIAAGIIFGLAGDAWWNERQDQAREGEYLKSLSQDFQANLADLERAIAHNDSVFGSATFLLETMSAQRNDIPRDSLVDHLALLFMAGPHTPVTATYDELVASGDLRLIRDRELRKALAEWATLVEFQDVVTAFFWDQWAFLHTPFILEETVFSDFDPDYEGFVFPRAPYEMDYGRLLRSRRFWNLVSLRIVVATDLKNHEEGKMLPAVDRILQRLAGLQ